MYRVIVAGDRRLTLAHYEIVRAKLDAVLAHRLPGVVILSGEAPGADALGERYADERGLSCERFPADWVGEGRAAGPIRNRQMARSPAHACVVFSGGGPGSRSMIREAEAASLALRVIDVSALLT